ncbi:TetR/AcrR family transcriptional regulator [Antrihabitans cavernicola]|uniref:TetR/AcrR family transcriptional regulator n=1 Tax=Antrihabitans cavernicola TaxID=2495913 RepID=A0A5A7S3A4_9NOCA|nr:TetR/AcrR family transcriptional regulator [Spelaeibacter cavernicola]KAA0018986.1 TetR/AcrR family transcriptional regulator [Spelaeibacter cavernicola]
MPPTRRDWLVGGNREALAVERILGAAAKLIARDGPAAIDIDAIAAAAGCSRATVYRYVGGKSAIADAVLTRAAARIGDRVARAVSPLTGRERFVTAITASLAAVRGDPVASQLLDRTSSTTVNEYLLRAPELATTAATLAGIDAADDPLAAQWVVRVVLSFLSWPAETPDVERQLIERFVATAYEPNGPRRP